MNDKIRKELKILKQMVPSNQKNIIKVVETYLEVKGLPVLKPRILSKNNLEYQKGICEGRCQMHKEFALAYAKRELELQEKLDEFREVIKKHCFLIQGEGLNNAISQKKS